MQTHNTERDIWEVANQLAGYVGPDTDDRLAKFLMREAGEATKLAERIIELENTRPATPVEGLEQYDPYIKTTYSSDDVYEKACMRKSATGEYVRFDQTETIIAAKDETLRKFGNVQKAYEEHIEVLKTDNAALTARVKELEAHCKHLCDPTIYRLEKENEALETQLAAARKDAVTWEANFKALNAKYATRAALEAKP